MTILFEDSVRNALIKRTLEAVEAGTAEGAIISPFATPQVQQNPGSGKQAVTEIVDRLKEGGAKVWIDPQTHALQIPGCGDFRYYDQWSLWGGSASRGDLTSRSRIQSHVERVFAEQDALNVPHLAPTVLVDAPQSAASKVALEVAEVAVEQDPDCRLSIAGGTAFWAGGSALDALIGRLAQLAPSGWWLTVVRETDVLPVLATAEEVHGLSRTTRALSEDGPVHISHGDLAGLPAVAAGATSIGTGWDRRQRVFAYPTYQERDPDAEGGGWLQQPLFEGLLSLLSKADAATLAGQDPALSARLLPGTVAPTPAAIAFVHHAAVLTRLTAALARLDHRGAHANLAARYGAARVNWEPVADELAIRSRAPQWVGAMEAGHVLYGQTEDFYS